MCVSYCKAQIILSQSGVIVNEADNIADDQDYIHLLFTFRVKDEPYWIQGVDIPFTMSAAYVSDYVRSPTLLVDDSVVLTVVEPKLSLRVEVSVLAVKSTAKSVGTCTCIKNTYVLFIQMLNIWIWPYVLALGIEVGF